MKKIIVLFLSVSLLFALYGCGASNENNKLYEEIISSEKLEVEDALEMLHNVKESDGKLGEIKRMAGDLLLCENIFVDNDKDPGQLKTYTAKLDFYFQYGEAMCQIDYDGYVLYLDLWMAAAPVSYYSEDGYIFNTKPSCDDDFDIYIGREKLRIIWGDGICDYTLDRWSGDPAELENEAFEGSEGYQYVTAFMDSIFKSQEHLYHYNEDSRTLTVALTWGSGSRDKVIKNPASFRGPFEELCPLLEEASTYGQTYLDIYIAEILEFGEEAHCEILMVDHLKSNGEYSEDDIIIRVIDGYTLINLAE